MISQDVLESQIRRMGGLDDFPKFQPEAEAELVLVAGRFARSEAHLCGVIDEIMAVWTRCPKPSQFRTLLELGREENVVSSCIYCDGSGWVIIEKDGKSGARRCKCGSVPRPASEAVPFNRDDVTRTFESWFGDDVDKKPVN